MAQHHAERDSPPDDEFSGPIGKDIRDSPKAPILGLKSKSETFLIRLHALCHGRGGYPKNQPGWSRRNQARWVVSGLVRVKRAIQPIGANAGVLKDPVGG